ncbi:hypothetical protein [Faecalibacter bovis]|uniref:Guanylate cyclase domain-containing protein n=1 Tax=Faecalibacter bovis TaxID=2898187 RepID=A0ABX7XFQ2_9FLAO|nr:hypothetical protein [Faecalibacter bovis]QTV06741.1 hypothetical protein J9309_05350 [Faecalibacter bovis]
MTYEKRLCCFIDILGFKAHIDESKNNDSKIDSIANILKLNREIVNEDGLISKKITHFSDSIVISYKYDETDNIFFFLEDLKFLSIELAAKGYLVRGGVTVDDLIHEDNMIFGPAMVEAYELESKKAFYPRIIISKLFIETVSEIKDQHRQKDTLNYFNSALRIDDDRKFYLDYIEVSPDLDNEHGIVEYLQKLKLFFKDFDNQRDDVKLKLVWLKNKINIYIDKLHQNVEINEDLNQETIDLYKSITKIN